MTPQALISLKRAGEKTSLSRTGINQKRAAGQFPQAVPLGVKRIGFVEAEVDEWIAQRIKAREHAAEKAPAAPVQTRRAGKKRQPEARA